MADLIYTVDYTDIQQANRELNKIGATSQTLANKSSKVTGSFIPMNKEFRESLRLTRQKVAFGVRMQKQLEREAKLLNQAAAATNLYSNATQRSTKSMSRAGLVTQQVGYQVGDFLVQVQSGTNAMVAFGQQGTQLAGLLTGKFVALGAAIGILLPLATAVGAYFMRTRRDAEVTIESISSATSSLQSRYNQLENSTKAYGDAILVAGEASNTSSSLVLNNLAQEFSARKKLFEIEKIRFEISRQAAEQEIKARRETIDSLFEEANQAREVALLGASSEQERNAIQQTYLKITREIIQENQGLFLAQREQNAELSLMETLSQRLNEAFSESSAQMKQTAEETKRVAEALASAEAATRASNAEVYASVQLRATEARYGRESSEYLQQAQEFERRALEIRIQSEGVSAAVADELRRALEYSQGIARIEMASGIQAAAIAASTLAAQFGLAYENAYNLTLLQRAGRDQTIAGAFGGLGEGPQTFGTGGIGFGNGPRSPVTAPPPRRVSVARGSGGGGRSSGGGGGGKSAAQELSEEFERLKVSLDETYAAQKKFTEGKSILDRVFGENSTHEEYVRLLGLLQENFDEATNKGSDFASSMVDLGNTMRESLSSSFMAIVDGSKSASDAFGDMARTILKKAYDLLVIQPIMNSLFGKDGGGGLIGGFLGNLSPFANGGAFYGGNQIEAFANGGIVSRPTLFPMRGSSTGLMGEAGPEAIMPLKRGSNGKLGVQMEGGGGQSVVINQSFHFSANGDESVKKIIAQEAPKIAQYTKSSIMEDRRRGGSMKAAFG